MAKKQIHSDLLKDCCISETDTTRCYCDKIGYVSSSEIEEAGQGLFVKVERQKGDHISCYHGEIMNREQLSKIPLAKRVYILQLNQNTFINGSKKIKTTNMKKVSTNHSGCCYGKGQFANTLRSCNLNKKFNARFVIDQKHKRVRLVATCYIPKDSEVFVPYGCAYNWKSKGM